MEDYKKFLKDPIPIYYKYEIIKASCALAANVGIQVPTFTWDVKKNEISSKVLLDSEQIEKYIITVARKYGDYVIHNYPELLKTGEIVLDE